MRKLILLISILFSIASYSQKNISLPDNQISQRFYENLDSLLIEYDLEDLRKSDQLAIRIWRSNDIILLENNASYTFHSKSNKKSVLEKAKFKCNSNISSELQLIQSNIDWKDNNGKYRIDAFPITIELNNKDNYKVISFYQNEELEKIIKKVWRENNLDKVRNNIIENLPAGNYQLGMIGLKIDHLPEEEKSDFYKKIEPEIVSKLKVSENTKPTEMPLIVINNKPHFFKKLNDLELSDVENYEIINDGRKAIYGARARFGIINVITN